MSRRQFATFGQEWLGWFTTKPMEIKEGTLKEPFTISGNGKQVGDIAYAEDMVGLYLMPSQKIDAIKGEAFNVGGGMENSSSLLEMFDFLEKELIGWESKVSKNAGIRKMIEWIKNN